MTSQSQIYIAIDLKSFYASVECVERGLDPLTTNLVVADESRTEKTICLAVSPSLKAHGIPGRPRLFEVNEKLREVNGRRVQHAPGRTFVGESWDAGRLAKRPDLAVSYITAVPRMALYVEYSARIYEIYLKYAAAEDIHVYSIDEVFIDVTHYLGPAKMTAHDYAMKMIRDVLDATGITATAGIGTNLYLSKVAMDIVAKHMPADAYGVRIAELDEMLYRKKLWDHRPLTDFWRVGRGYAKKLEAQNLYTMGDIARCSIGKETDYYNEELLYKMFGVNAELLIDHAWGWEPCTIADVKAYKPESNSVSSGQVLQRPYENGEARLVVKEMADLLAMDLLDKRMVTDQIVLTIGYDIANLTGPGRSYRGKVHVDHYGRRVPEHAHGTENLRQPTSSARMIIDAAMDLFGRIADPGLLVRRITITANHVVREDSVGASPSFAQMDLFTDYAAQERRRQEEQAALDKERRAQEAALAIKKKFGKNAVLKGMNLQEGATARQRNSQIGGHRA